MIEAVLRISLPCSWVVDLTTAHGAVVNLVDQKPVEGGLLRTLVEIDPGGSDPAAIVATLQQNPYIVGLETIVPPKGKILATLKVRDCHACTALATSDCFLTDATAAQSGRLEWRILAPKRSSVEGLVRDLENRGLDVELAAIRTPRGRGALTSRQDQVLSLAYKLGYFEFPKKINLSQLAKKLGVAKSTLSEILRTGEEKILHTYFQGLLKRPR